VAISENEQLRKLMFNYDDDDEDQEVVYPSMNPLRFGGVIDAKTSATDA
jgi:hypothetical protein